MDGITPTSGAGHHWSPPPTIIGSSPLSTSKNQIVSDLVSNFDINKINQKDPQSKQSQYDTLRGDITTCYQATNKEMMGDREDEQQQKLQQIEISLGTIKGYVDKYKDAIAQGTAPPFVYEGINREYANALDAARALAGNLDEATVEAVPNLSRDSFHFFQPMIEDKMNHLKNAVGDISKFQGDDTDLASYGYRTKMYINDHQAEGYNYDQAASNFPNAIHSFKTEATQFKQFLYAIHFPVVEENFPQTDNSSTLDKALAEANEVVQDAYNRSDSDVDRVFGNIKALMDREPFIMMSI